MYELSGVTIRSVSPSYRTVQHEFQLVWTNSSRYRELATQAEPTPVSPFIDLCEIDALPINSIISRIINRNPDKRDSDQLITDSSDLTIKTALTNQTIAPFTAL